LLGDVGSFFERYATDDHLERTLSRPTAMDRDKKAPMLVTLVGVVDGTIACGITGLFLGPIVPAASWELLTAWTNDQTAKH